MFDCHNVCGIHHPLLLLHSLDMHLFGIDEYSSKVLNQSEYIQLGIPTRAHLDCGFQLTECLP